MMIDDKEQYVGTIQIPDNRSKEELKNTFFVIHDLDGNEVVDCVYAEKKKLIYNTFLIRNKQTELAKIISTGLLGFATELYVENETFRLRSFSKTTFRFAGYTITTPGLEYIIEIHREPTPLNLYRGLGLGYWFWLHSGLSG